MWLNPGAAVAGGQDHPRMADGPPRMMCSFACRATYMKWVARINAHPSTQARVRIARVVAGDVSHPRAVGLVLCGDASVRPPTDVHAPQRERLARSPAHPAQTCSAARRAHLRRTRTANRLQPRANPYPSITADVADAPRWRGRVVSVWSRASCAALPKGDGEGDRRRPVLRRRGQPKVVAAVTWMRGMV
jgi:hypothetical protein